MTEQEKLSMMSISFKINSEFEKIWEEAIKHNPHLGGAHTNVTVFSPEKLKDAMYNMFVRGAGVGVVQFRVEHKV